MRVVAVTSMAPLKMGGMGCGKGRLKLRDSTPFPATMPSVMAMAPVQEPVTDPVRGNWPSALGAGDWLKAAVTATDVPGIGLRVARSRRLKVPCRRR